MAYVQGIEESEIVISKHEEQRWRDREKELSRWIATPKPVIRAKRTICFSGTHVDAELLPALTILNQLGIATEYSCAGVSLRDEPVDHSLYAYITFPASPQADAFVKLAMERMRHRLQVSYEPGRNRYDLSSFYIGHNRSFCLLMESCARALQEQENQRDSVDMS
ncbi:hypothetical protein [Paenibacillus sp. PL2-23]|uniref:hypothetical protein n=1 Tax=Paenibacillus sp. PL2-23 TaxID=2100729 RepID=UPI0030FC8AD4